MRHLIRKTRVTRFEMLAVGPLLVLASITVVAQTNPDPPKIREVERIVVASPPPNTTWDPAAVGRELKMREIVEARERSRAVLSISRGRVLRVNSNSRLRIVPAILQGGSPGLDLQKGEIYLHSRDPGRAMEVTTPVVTGKPNGTQFRVRVEDDGTTTFTMFEGTVELSNPHGGLTLGNNEQGIIEPGKAPRRTARIDAKNSIQWCLYYPGVIDLDDIGMKRDGRGELAAAIAAYRAGDLLGALTACPVDYQPESEAERIFHAMILLSVGQVEDARAQLAPVRADAPGRRAIEEMIDAVNFVERPMQPEPRTASEWLARSYYEQSRSSPQQGFRLENALAAARKASAMAPHSGFAAVRVAELEFSFGHTRAAMGQLSRGLQLTPRNAQAYSLQGFMLSDWNCMEAARASFETAIELDSALGTAWLGRGLCDIRRGKGEEGRGDLQTATILEPNRSLFHSYLGKAASQLGDNKAAMEDLEFAKKLDPADPTPWLYSALVLQEQNRPNEAIGALQQSINRNENRALYRSSMLLDQDRAVRSANLAKLYQYNGMREVAVREATRAVEADYSNPSAHLFLSNAFDALRDPDRILLRHETPWFNELLLFNLLSPVGGGPLSQFVSQNEYSKLLEADGTGGSITTEATTESEISTIASVFGTHGKISYGLDYYWRDDPGDRPNSEFEIQEIYAQIKWQPSPDDIFYFLGKWSTQNTGDNFQTYDNQPLAPNVDFEENQEPGLLLAGWNHRWAPGSNTLFLGGRLEAHQTLTDRDTGQYLLKRNPAGLTPGFVKGNPNSGYRFVDSSLDGTVTVDDEGTVLYSKKFLDAIDSFVGKGKVMSVDVERFDFETERQFEIYTAELQHIQQDERNTFVAGARWQGGKFDTDTRLTLVRSDPDTDPQGFSTPAAHQQVTSDFNRTSLYAYDFWSPLHWLTLIGGTTWDWMNHPENFRNPPVSEGQQHTQQWSGKLGFTMSPSPWFNFRGAYTEGLGGVTFDESIRLEPSQIAGFGQAYRTIISESIAGSVEAPLFKTWGLGVDGELPTRTWWGISAQVIEQDVERTIGAFSGYDLPGALPTTPAYFQDGTSQQLDYREASLGFSLNQLVGDEFAIGLGYLVTQSDLRTIFPEFPDGNPVIDPNSKDRAVLQELSLYGLWNSPTGWFARIEANWYGQDLKDTAGGISDGYLPRDGDSFWQFNAVVGYRFNRNQSEISVGLLNITDADYQLSPLNPYDDIARERIAVVSCRFSF